MEAKEIRIGNYVNYDNKDAQINIEDFAHIIKYDNQLINPIPLTEEWLLKFGFKIETPTNQFINEFIINCGEYVMGVCFNTFSSDNWFISIRTSYGNQPVTIQQKYVHQLQNLYFALTGKELETL